MAKAWPFNQQNRSSAWNGLQTWLMKPDFRPGKNPDLMVQREEEWNFERLVNFTGRKYDCLINELLTSWCRGLIYIRGLRARMYHIYGIVDLTCWITYQQNLLIPFDLAVYVVNNDSGNFENSFTYTWQTYWKKNWRSIRRRLGLFSPPNIYFVHTTAISFICMYVSPLRVYSISIYLYYLRMFSYCIHIFSVCTLWVCPLFVCPL